MQQPQQETVTLSDILITEELESRTSRSANFQAENQALRTLARQLVQKETILQNVVDMALELCQAQTAGVSLLETSKNLINHPVKNHLVENDLVEWASLPVPSIGQAGTPTLQENFCWNVIAGTLKQHVGAITPRNFSPCSICLDRGIPQLFSYPERYFTYLQADDTPIVEELVLPLIADNHVFGTIWIKSHDKTRHFDSEDVRLMTSLAEFITTALSLNQLNQPQTQELPALNASALRESEELSRALIENLPGGAAFVVDHDLRYLLAEGEALSQAGFKAEDFIGHTIFEVLSPELAANYKVLYRQALAGELFEHEHNAHGRWYISRGTPLREENGEVYAALAVSYDISDRKQAENALHESEECLRLATEVAQIYSWEFDLKTQTPKFSDNFERITGRAPSQSFVENLQFVYPEDRASVIEAFKRAINNDNTFDYEMRAFNGDNQINWYRVSGVIIRDTNNEPIRAVGISQNITDSKQALSALRQSEERMQAVANLVPDLLWDSEVDGSTNWYNQRWMEYTGQTFEQAIGWGWTNAIHPDDKEASARCYKEAVETGKPLHQEHRILRHDGEYRWFVVNAFPLKDESGKVVKMYGAATDITERKCREANLAFLNEVSQDLAQLTNIDETMNALGAKIGGYFGASLCAFSVIGEGAETMTTAHAWNRAGIPSTIGVHRISDYHTEEFLWACHTGETYVVRDASNEARMNAALMANLQASAFVSVPLVREGEWLFNLSIADTVPRDWTEDEIELMRELTTRIWTRLERARAEAALRESERKLQSAIAVAQLSPYEWNPLTGSFKWDARLKAMWGLPADAQINYEIYNAGIHPQDREYVERQVEEAIDPNGDGIFEAEFRTVGIEDKIERWVSVRGQTFFDAQGRPVHYVGTAQDVTDRKQALSDRIQLIREQTAREEERQRAEALAQLDRAKTTFFSNVSHEFRTPLTLLLAPLQDVLSDCTNLLTPPQRERLEIAHRNAIRLLKLVNTLLDFSCLEAGRMEAVYQPTDLATFTTELASLFRSAIEQVGLKLIVDCPPLPLVYVDREMWEKIVLNLLSNAFKFTLEGEIVVRLYQYNNDHYVTLQVQDTGTGIPADELPHIFERFYHVRTTKARTYEGTGIGLALVQELIKMHGGTVEVSSIVEQGTCFTVKIPLGTAHLPTDHIKYSAELKVLSAKKEERKHYSLNTQHSALSTHLFILLVDDNADMRDYLKRILSEHVQVEAVANGAAAMAIIEERVPDLVLSDVMMPHLDGFGLLKALRADPRTKEVPIILLSARAGEESVIEGLQAGADDYLIKPFSATELVTRVLAHLQLAQLRAEALHHEKASNRMKDKLLAEVSHELQAPLVSILGWTRLLRSSPSNQSILVRALETIERSATLQAKLIQDLLDVSRITSGKISLNKAPVELHSVIELVLATVHQAQQSKDICLECILNPKSITVEGDADRLQQIVLNLLTNAIKFTPEGGRIEVYLGVAENQAQIKVRDTGIGIEPEFLPYVFETFRQSKNSKTGLGLGLAIARQLVQLHGGALTAESNGTGQGATFTVKLPLINVNL